MESIASISNISHIIQLAVGPVFLLAGIAGFLNVMSGRLGRIVDRTREIERRLLALKSPEMVERANRELVILRQRSRLNNFAIGFCTLSGLLTCLLVVTLFIGSYWGLNIGEMTVLFFVLTMLSLICSLVMFLRETVLATRTLRLGGEFLDVDIT